MIETRILVKLLRTYFPRNWEFGSALLKTSEFQGGLNPQTLPLGTPLGNAYRCTMLSNLQETTICHDANGAPKITKEIQTSTNDYVKKKDYIRSGNLSVARHPRNTIQQLPPSHHKVRSELMSDRNSNYIPTIVNGQINPTKKDNNINSTNNKLDHIHKLLSESTVKLFNSKAKYSKCSKHKVLLMDDIH